MSLWLSGNFHPVGGGHGMVGVSSDNRTVLSEIWMETSGSVTEDESRAETIHRLAALI